MVIKSINTSIIKNSSKAALIALVLGFFSPAQAMLSSMAAKSRLPSAGGSFARNGTASFLRPSSTLIKNSAGTNSTQTLNGTPQAIPSIIAQPTPEAIVPTDNSWQSIGLNILGRVAYDNALPLASIAYSGAKIAGKVTAKALKKITNQGIPAQQFQATVAKIKEPLLTTPKTTPKKVVQKTARKQTKKITFKEVREAAQEYKKLQQNAARRAKAELKKATPQRTVTPATPEIAPAVATPSDSSNIRNATPEPTTAIAPTAVPATIAVQIQPKTETIITVDTPMAEQAQPVVNIPVVPQATTVSYPLVPVNDNNALVTTTQNIPSKKITIDLSGINDEEQRIIAHVAEMYKKQFEAAQKNIQKTEPVQTEQQQVNNQYALVPHTTQTQQSHKTTKSAQQTIVDVRKFLQQQHTQFSTKARTALARMTAHFNNLTNAFGKKFGKNYNTVATQQPLLMLTAPQAPAAHIEDARHIVEPQNTPDHVIQEEYNAYDARERMLMTGEPLQQDIYVQQQVNNHSALVPFNTQGQQTHQEPNVLKQTMASVWKFLKESRAALGKKTRKTFTHMTTHFNNLTTALGRKSDIKKTTIQPLSTIIPTDEQAPAPAQPEPPTNNNQSLLPAAALGALAAATYAIEPSPQPVQPQPSNDTPTAINPVINTETPVIQTQPAPQQHDSLMPVGGNAAPATLQTQPVQPGNNPLRTIDQAKNAAPAATQPIHTIAPTEIKSKLQALVQTISNRGNGINLDIGYATREYCAGKKYKRASLAAAQKKIIMTELANLKTSLGITDAATMQLVDSCTQDIATLFDGYITLYNKCPQYGYREYLKEYASQTSQLRDKIEKLTAKIGN